MATSVRYLYRCDLCFKHDNSGDYCEVNISNKSASTGIICVKGGATPNWKEVGESIEIAFDEPVLTLSPTIEFVPDYFEVLKKKHYLTEQESVIVFDMYIQERSKVFCPECNGMCVVTCESFQEPRILELSEEDGLTEHQIEMVNNGFKYMVEKGKCTNKSIHG